MRQVLNFTFHSQSGMWFRDADGAGPFVHLGGGVMSLMAEGLPPNNSHSMTLEASHVVHAGPCTVFEVTVCNNSGSAQFYQLHDAASEPANTAVPVITKKIAAGASDTFYFGRRGRSFTTGCVATNSSTAATLTVGAADSFFDAQYQ